MLKIEEEEKKKKMKRILAKAKKIFIEEDENELIEIIERIKKSYNIDK